MSNKPRVTGKVTVHGTFRPASNTIRREADTNPTTFCGGHFVRSVGCEASQSVMLSQLRLDRGRQRAQFRRDGRIKRTLGQVPDAGGVSDDLFGKSARSL